MPKQLDNIENIIIEKGKELLYSTNYTDFSMRKVADSCGIAVGTLYNYIKNKDDLIAKIALTDWKHCLSNIQSLLDKIDNISDAAIVIYKEISSFKKLYFGLFSSYSVKFGADDTVKLYHPYLRKAVQGFIEPYFKDFNEKDRENALPVLSEIILSCATNGDISEEQFIAFLKMIKIGG